MNNFTKKDFITLLNKFAEQGKLFINEKQLQLELAIALKEAGYDIELEVVSKSKGNRKQYTDIVINLENDKCIAIELKHKLKQKIYTYKINDRNFYSASQGAYNIGSYAFLKDVERLEKFTKEREDKLEFNFGNKKIVRGYALLITNDKAYFTESKKNDRLCKDFYLSGQKQNYLYWYAKSNNTQIALKTEQDCKNYYSKNYKNKYPIFLKGNYFCEWEPYKLQGCKEYGTSVSPLFQYLLFEITKD